MARRARAGILNPGEARGRQQLGISRPSLDSSPIVYSQPDSGQEAEAAWETTGLVEDVGLPYKKLQRELETEGKCFTRCAAVGDELASGDGLKKTHIKQELADHHLRW